MMALTRSRIWFAVFVVVVFLLGLAAGMAIDRFSPGDPWTPRGRGAMGPGPRPSVMADRISRELDLNDKQREQLEQVFQRGAGRLEQFRRDSRQQFMTLSRELNSEIEAVLTPDQREKFREMRRERPRRGQGRRLRQ